MRQLLRRLWYAIRQHRLEAELAEELEFHRAMKQREIEDRGIDPKEAGFAARRELGSAALAREDARAVWIGPCLESVCQDGVYALRQLRRQPGFAIVAVLMLALGTGANTSIFAMLDALLLRPAPVSGPDLLVVVRRGARALFSYPDYRDYQSRTRLLSGLAASAPWESDLAVDGQSEFIAAEAVSGNYSKVVVSPLFSVDGSKRRTSRWQ